VSARPEAGRVAVLGLALALGGAWQALLILVLLTAVLWADEIAAVAVKALRAALREVREWARQRRELNQKLLELEAAQARQAQAGPVPCAHWQAVPVPGVGGDVVAWLCPACDTQLPANFRVLEAGR
jgi:Sec-independent protein translocase protein TatA